MTRPPVDVVVPFVGSDADLSAVAARMGAIDLAAGDTVTIADNRATAQPGERQITEYVKVRGAAGLPSSYFARNRGIEGGSNPWIVFLDADVDPAPDLLSKYFEPAPAQATGGLIGGIYDAPPGADASAPELYSHHKGAVGHLTTTRDDGFSFAQTANVAVRRDALESIGGFTEGVRSGGDADMCFRIQRAGFAFEPRYDARVEHENRKTIRAFARVNARYGSGSAWLDSIYPGFAPRPRPVRFVLSLGASVVRALAAILRGNTIEAQVHLMDGVQKVATTVGRMASNQVAP